MAKGNVMTRVLNVYENEDLRLVKFIHGEATDILNKRLAAGKGKRTPIAVTGAAPAPKRQRRSRSKAAKAAAASSAGGTATTSAPGDGGTNGSLSMSEQQRTVDEANAQ